MSEYGMGAALFWFRRDLRLKDNPALLQACRHNRVYLLYIDASGERRMGAAQRCWLEQSLYALAAEVRHQGGELTILQGDPVELLPRLVQCYGMTHCYWNRRYDAEGMAADGQIQQQLERLGTTVVSMKGNLLGPEPREILTGQGTPYQVFTAFYKAVWAQLDLATPRAAPSLQHAVPIKERAALETPDSKVRLAWGDQLMTWWQAGETGAWQQLENFVAERLSGYDTRRDYMAAYGTSRLSPHLALGELSVQAVAGYIYQHVPEKEAVPFLRQLVWRDFARYLSWYFPESRTRSLQPKFRDFSWREDVKALQTWQAGETGYPLVDAGMKELWETGYMHNRVRMVTASFLTKHLLIPWQSGEQWFWDTLVDADAASNVMNWQWVAGCGVDAAPYFRIFNPIRQSERFDPQGHYIRKWLPELGEQDNKAVHQPDYQGNKRPQPMVEHSFARQRALAAYQEIKQGKRS